ncbi:Histone acetyl transferase HAT1 N-terminus [Carpediemonas membranifera]|uniref:histone acetyltransferase n=1 Tax=Carpediemonas membranifera TaxID=201153 RepID=A0A8J6E3J8_9EUKA|nr:Histone acetyl transferase HAT1 N-terminus [Carpediemonas membranifera]|eukprot:KAG9396023.1 Histone acetyl transferase HAT1 N-terminus [Carpediemonas membranifera]
MEEQLREASADSTEAITLHMAQYDDDNKAPGRIGGPIHPELTHQLFVNERIIGYKNPHIKMFFSPASLVPYYTFNHEGLAQMTVTTTTPERKGARRFLATIFSKRAKEDTMDVDLSDALRTDPKEAVEPSLTDKAESMEAWTAAVASDKTYTPPGKLVTRFKVQGRSFELYHARFADDRAAKLVRRLDILVKMFIDGGNPIDAVEYWNLLFLFERRPTGPVLAAYSCLWEDYCHPSTRALKLCQLLVLPPYRRMGLATRMVVSCRQVGSHLKLPVGLYTFNEPAESLQAVRLLADVIILLETETISRLDDVRALYLKERVDSLAWKLKIEPFELSRVLICCWAYLDTDKNRKEWNLAVRKLLYAENFEDLSLLEKSDRVKYIEKLEAVYAPMFKRVADSIGSVETVLMQTENCLGRDDVL